LVPRASEHVFASRCGSGTILVQDWAIKLPVEKEDVVRLRRNIMWLLKLAKQGWGVIPCRHSL